MARVSYVGDGSSFRRMLNHSPAVSDAYWALREALDEGVLSPKLRMLTFLAVDLTNECHY